MKKILTFCILFCAYGAMAQPIPQTQKVTEKFFPDMSYEIATPAFQKNKGFTKHDELMTFLDALVKAHPEDISYRIIGESQKGKPIPMVTITHRAVGTEKIKVFMQGGIHGNEPASTEGLLFLMDRLLNDPANDALLDQLEIGVIPMANIDGYEKQNRYAADGLDLNRDQTKFTAHESPILKKAWNEFNPQVAVDFHEYRSYRRDFTKMSDWGVTSYFDVMFLYSGNLNVPEPLRRFTQEKFVNPAKAVMDDHELRHHDYMTATDYHGELQFNQGSTNPRSSATNYALSHCISTLI